MMICSADGKIFQLPCLILLWSWTIIKNIVRNFESNIMVSFPRVS